MDKIENKTVKDIFQELTSGKTIYGIKDSNMNIILRNPNRWLDIIIAIVVLILGLGIIQVLNQSEKVVGILLTSSIFIFFISLFIMSTTVRVSGGKVILYNLIRKKKIVDLNKKFRIYTRCIESERYNISTEMWHHVKDYVIHFQQDDVDIPVDMYFIGSKKLNLLLENLKFKENE